MRQGIFLNTLIGASFNKKVKPRLGGTWNLEQIVNCNLQNGR